MGGRQDGRAAARHGQPVAPLRRHRHGGRFLAQAAANVGAPLVCIREGRTPWQVFFDVRFLGNSRVDPCSRILKRQAIDRWLATNCDPAETVVYVGIDWTEIHRFDDGHGNGIRPRKAAAGWRYEAPLCGPPYWSKRDILLWLELEGVEPPRLYEMGFAHNNCGGFCIKAGQGHYATLLEQLPARYAEHEQKEQEIRALLGDVSILRDRSGGSSRPLSLKEFRERVEAKQKIDRTEIGGCACFTPDDETIEYEKFFA